MTMSRSTEKRDAKPLRTPEERMVAEELEKIFLASTDPVATRLENFTKYVRRQHLTRFLALYEVFKRALPVKGSVVECGVNRGFGLMAWAKLSAVLEPVNLTRRIYGFDSFAGFPSVTEKDRTGPAWETAAPGALRADSYAELKTLIELGSAIIIVETMKVMPRAGFIPETNMWCPHTMKPNPAMPAIE